jgi:hypothetical protein
MIIRREHHQQASWQGRRHEIGQSGSIGASDGEQMRPNCPCSLTGEHDVYFNKGHQLGKLAKVTALPAWSKNLWR